MLSKKAKLVKGKRVYTGSGRAVDNDVMLKDIVNDSSKANGIGHSSAFGVSIEVKDIKDFIEYLKGVDIPEQKHEYDFMVDIDELGEDEIDFVSYCNFFTSDEFPAIQYRIENLIIKAIKETGSGNLYFNDANGIRYSQYNKKWLNSRSVDDVVSVNGTISNEMYFTKSQCVMMVEYIEDGEDDDLWT